MIIFSIEKMVNDGSATEVPLIARDKFPMSTFHVIIDSLKPEMSRRGQVCNDIAERFFRLVEVPELSST